MLFYYHCRIVNGVEDITDFFICIIIIDRVYLTRVVFRSEWHCCSKELQVTLNERSIPVQQQNPDFPTANNVLMIPERHNTNQINLDVEQQVKTLGLSWNPTTDTINFQVKLSDKEFFTKRIILSNISRLFDPLGLASVVTIKARIALQKIGKTKKFEWNDPLPKEMQLVWKKLFAEIQDLNTVQFPQYLQPPSFHGTQNCMFLLMLVSSCIEQQPTSFGPPPLERKCVLYPPRPEWPPFAKPQYLVWNLWQPL